jgi:hypothetical protein
MTAPRAKPMSDGMRAAWRRWAHPKRAQIREHARLRAGIEHLRRAIESRSAAAFKARRPA